MNTPDAISKGSIVTQNCCPTSTDSTTLTIKKRRNRDPLAVNWQEKHQQCVSQHAEYSKGVQRKIRSSGFKAILQKKATLAGKAAPEGVIVPFSHDQMPASEKDL